MQSSATNPKALLLKPRDAAELLAISERKLWQLMHDGVIPAVRYGRLVRYDVRDLEASIQNAKRSA